MDKATQPFTTCSTPLGRSQLSFRADGAPVLAPISRAEPEQQNATRLAEREPDLRDPTKANSGNAHSFSYRSPRAATRHDKEKDWFEAFPGERLTIRVHSGEVDGKFTILENVADDGVATPMHIHTQDEVFHVLEGEVVFSMDGKTSVLQQGSEILIPAGTPHAWRNKSGNRIRLLVFFAPGGIEELYLRASGLTHTEIAELAVQYGTLVVGLPIPK